ncbi:ATP-dependent helicase [Naasia lichenicola]|uniref:DNA 3'-5' helicase n=1 Tax=Naasia lichenicola TaxID=2565933 RepID=A0A4S4FHB7_9MICO|nr:ATP-dependent DNA helicase [Naasia lichenicola]THG28495.1 ATP-dependent helicase [Naasia lichenicola]
MSLELRPPRPALADAVQLDPSQRAVLRLPDAMSAAVIGAPGSGKTTALVELVAQHLLERDWASTDLLVLAASRQSATALRDRLGLRVGIPTTGPLARTIVSAAYSIARSEALRMGREAPRLLTGGEQDAIVADLLEGNEADGTGPVWPPTLPAEVRALPAFRTELRELIGRTTELAMTTPELARLGRAHDHPEWVAAAEFVAQYQDVLDQARETSLDSADLLAEATAAILAGHESSIPRLVVVDDGHELTSAGVGLLRAWASRGARVIVFGDPDVSSTGFRGAQPGFLSDLGEHLGLGDLPTLVLRQVHRHDATLRSLVQETTRLIGSVGLVAHREASSVPVGGVAGASAAVAPSVPASDSVQRISAGTGADEVRQIARLLREQHVLQGVPWHRMAVVVRSGRSIPTITRGLAVHEVPSRASLASRPLREQWAPRHLMTLVAVGSGLLPATAERLTELLLGPFGGLDGVSLRRLRLALRHVELADGGSRSADALLEEAMATEDGFAGLDLAAARSAGRLAGSIARLRAATEAEDTIEELLWLAWDRSGLARTWEQQSRRTGVLGDEADHHLDGVVALFTAARNYVERSPHRTPTEFLAEQLETDVPDDSLAPRSTSDSVIVCTPTAVIGAEFDVVVVAGVQEGVWPNLRLRGSLLHPQALVDVAAGLPIIDLDERRAVLNDELRMFALAVSRATRLLVVSAVMSADEQPSAFTRLVEKAPLRVPAPYPLSLRGMVGSLRRELVADPTSRASYALARLAQEGVAGADPASWYGLEPISSTAPLVDLAAEGAVVRVSPSQLEKWEKVPLNWFLDAMAASPSGLAANLGTVLHSAMEEFSLDPDADVSVPALVAAIEERWSELEFESEWLETAQRAKTQRLIEGISQYLVDFRDSGSELLGAETRFELAIGGALLSGTIDRIERDREGRVQIVDLKTGATKPAAADLPDHAQLGAYQLAAQAGVLDVIPAGAEQAGAKLLFVSSPQAGRMYWQGVQGAYDDEAVERFRARIAAAAAGMAADSFPGTEVVGDRHPLAEYAKRIHLLGEVSS